MRLLVLIALALAGCGEASTADESSAVDRPSAADEPPESDDRFVPPTHRDGDRTVMPLTFPDGTRAAITYPPELAIAELGLEPYGSATLQGDSPHPGRSDEVGRDFAIRYGASLRPRRRSLVLRFGQWAVEVYDYAARSPAAMTRAERRDFRRSLTGRVTAGGFLVLEAEPPLRLAEAGEHAGPALHFGNQDRSPWLLLFLQRCDPSAESTSRGFASWCLSDTMVAHAYGGRRFLAAAAEGIELR